MEYVDQILHAYACQHCLTTERVTAFLMDMALLSTSRAGRGQLVKMLITLEPHGTCICRSNFAYPCV